MISQTQFPRTYHAYKGNFFGGSKRGIRICDNIAKSIYLRSGAARSVTEVRARTFGCFFLYSLAFSTSGVSFESEPMRVVIPACTLHQIVITGKATETGTLTIRGCFVQAPGGIPREYILPLYTNEEEERISRKRRVILSENGRSKYPPLERCSKARAADAGAATGPSFKFLECKVVPEQPLLRIRRSSVTHGALMLYDGEKWVFTLFTAFFFLFSSRFLSDLQSV